MLTDPGRHVIRLRSVTLAVATDRRRLATVIALMVPVVLVVIMGWQHRWISDDGFINFRYVDQIRDGNGPVFNAGERVESGLVNTATGIRGLPYGVLRRDRAEHGARQGGRSE